MKRDDGTVLRLKGLDFLEPPEAQRKGRSTPLPWAKMRSPADSSPEGERHALRIEGLKARRNGWLALAIYHEIVRVLTARSAALRWYLIGSDFRPATAAEVAQWIAQPDRRAVGAALRALEAVGLLERVRAPDFAAAHREDRKPIVPDGPVAPSDAETGEDRPSSPDERTVSGAAPETCAENGASEAEKRAAFRRGAGQRGGDYRQETRDGRSAGPVGPSARQTGNERRETASAPSAPPPQTADGPPAVAVGEGAGPARAPSEGEQAGDAGADPPATQPTPTPPTADDDGDTDDAEARDDSERVVTRELPGGVVEVGVETADPNGADADADAGPTADEPTGADPGGGGTAVTRQARGDRGRAVRC